MAIIINLEPGASAGLTFGDLTSLSTNLTVTNGVNAVIGTGTQLSLTVGNLTVSGSSNFSWNAGATGAVLGAGAALTVTVGNLTVSGTSNMSWTGGTGAVLGAGSALSVTVGNLLVGSGLSVSGGTGSVLGGNVTVSLGTVPIGNGGTGQTTALAAFNALSPLTTKGDLLTFDGTNNVRQAVGSNDVDLVVPDSAVTNGLRWQKWIGSQDLVNLGLSITASAGALTIALKTAAGSNPSSTDKVYIGFKGDETNGQFSRGVVSAALSTVISSGSTAGFVASLNQTLYIYAILNGSTVELAWSGILWDESRLVTTTAEGGAGGADSRNNMYSTTARTDVPFRLIGQAVFSLSTAGTWLNPAIVSLLPFEKQVVFASYETNAGQTISASSAAIVDFEDRIADTHNAVTTGSSWKFTAPKSGVYLVSINLNVGGNPIFADATFTIELRKNGTTLRYMPQFRIFAASSGANIGITGSCAIELSRNDYIDVRFGNGDDSGQSLTAFSGYNSVDILMIQETVGS